MDDGEGPSCEPAFCGHRTFLFANRVWRGVASCHPLNLHHFPLT